MRVRWLRNCLIALGLIAGPRAFSQQPSLQAVQMLRERLLQESDAWSPADVMERCAEHIATVQGDATYIRYFDLSSVPRRQRPAATSSLFFWVNSASSCLATIRPVAVPNTDGRLFWIDLRWYKWTPEAWEKVAKFDPYFREPIVPSNSEGLRFLRTTTAGNPVVRADFFSYYVGDTTLFFTRENRERADDAFYYVLLYAQNTLVRNGQKVVGAIPANEDEFQASWFVELDHLKQFAVDKIAVIDEGQSLVALQNRLLWRVSGRLGTYWKTYDVYRTAGDQDFVEGIFPKGGFDATEQIVILINGKQVYFLGNGKGARVEFADPFIARDRTDSHRGIVTTAASCAICHQEGIRPFTNELITLQSTGIELKTSPNNAIRIRAMTEALDRLVTRDQADYADFIFNCNGLTPQQNASQLSQFRNWYSEPVTFAQAARELGTDPETLEFAMSRSAKGRLARFVTDKRPIPRMTWESGLYQEAGLLLLTRHQTPIMP